MGWRSLVYHSHREIDALHSVEANRILRAIAEPETYQDFEDGFREIPLQERIKSIPEVALVHCLLAEATMDPVFLLKTPEFKEAVEYFIAASCGGLLVFKLTCGFRLRSVRHIQISHCWNLFAAAEQPRW